MRGYKDVLPSEFVGGCGLAPAGHTCKRRPAQVLDCHCALAHADTRHVLACHCEERSDVAIRSPAAAQSREQRLRRIRRRATDLPEVVPTWQVSLGGCGLPRRGAAAPLLAMTCRRRVRFCVCKDMGRDGVQKEEARVGVQGRVPAVFRQCPLANADTRHVLACHCEERSDVAIRFSLRNHKTRNNFFRRIRKVLRICLNSSQLGRFPWGDADCHVAGRPPRSSQ